MQGREFQADAWRSSQGELAREILRQLAEAGVLEPSRDEPMDRVRRWMMTWSDEGRAGVCRILREAREKDLSAVELAAMISDFLMSLMHGVPCATLSVYIVRFVGEAICKGQI